MEFEHSGNGMLVWLADLNSTQRVPLVIYKNVLSKCWSWFNPKHYFWKYTNNECWSIVQSKGLFWKFTNDDSMGA